MMIVSLFNTFVSIQCVHSTMLAHFNILLSPGNQYFPSTVHHHGASDLEEDFDMLSLRVEKAIKNDAFLSASRSHGKGHRKGHKTHTKRHHPQSAPQQKPTAQPPALPAGQTKRSPRPSFQNYPSTGQEQKQVASQVLLSQITSFLHFILSYSAIIYRRFISIKHDLVRLLSLRIIMSIM